LKLSLVFPILEERKAILQSAQDLVSFWSRFPVEIEVVLVLDPGRGTSAAGLEEELSTLLSSQNSRLSFKVLAQKSRQGRGAAVLRGLNEASGEILAVNSLDLSIPLGEVFSALQEFILDRERSFLLLGNRRGAKKKRKYAHRGARHFFENAEHEKAQSLQVKDPTTPFFMLKKKDWSELQIPKLRSWFYTPQIIQAARRKGLEVRDLEIQCTDRVSSKLRWRDGLL